MMIHEITGSVGRHKPRKRVGRGHSSGQGKTCGRGHKGAASRSGWKQRPGYEGGQMPLLRRMPKRGFTNTQFKNRYHVVNIKTLESYVADGAEVTAETLATVGVIRDTHLPLKVLGEGELTRKLSVTAAKFSASARAKIEAVGGTTHEVTRKKWTRHQSSDRSTEKKPAKGRAKPTDSGGAS